LAAEDDKVAKAARREAMASVAPMIVIRTERELRPHSA
jgi:hypothetical protein